MTLKIPRVLIVDDDQDIALFLRYQAARLGYQIDFVYASDVGEAVDRLNELCCDAAVIDVVLNGVTGVSLVQEIRRHDKLIPLAYLTNLDEDEVRQQAKAHNAYFLFKQHFWMTDEGPAELMSILDHMAHMNQCLDGGKRIDNLGFERQLAQTPLRMAEPFMKLLEKSRARVAA
jgi:CheY-like chemotaxis protein